MFKALIYCDEYEHIFSFTNKDEYGIYDDMIDETTDFVVVMTEKYFSELNYKPLSGRLNIIAGSSQIYTQKEVLSCRDIQDLLDVYKNNNINLCV